MAPVAQKCVQVFEKKGIVGKHIGTIAAQKGKGVLQNRIAPMNAGAGLQIQGGVGPSRRRAGARLALPWEWKWADAALRPTVQSNLL